MDNYVIFTDSGCDISEQALNEWGVKYLCLTFMFDGSEETHGNYDLNSKEFYDYMRQGKVARTSAINSQTFKDSFEAELKAGNDIIYLGFSSGLSTTYNSARMAADELKENYPERKIYTIDTLSASAGQGLLVYFAAEKKKSGATIDELNDYLIETSPKMCHWFTVDDLVYLKRGGRVSPAVALIGTALGIKPVLHVDDEGHLISVSKVRGRKSALKALVDKYGELSENPGGDTVFLCNADCAEDVECVKEMLNERYGAKVEYVADIGPVIGAHSGPGTIAIFFLGKAR